MIARSRRKTLPHFLPIVSVHTGKERGEVAAERTGRQPMVRLHDGGPSSLVGFHVDVENAEVGRLERESHPLFRLLSGRDELAVGCECGDEPIAAIRFDGRDGDKIAHTDALIHESPGCVLRARE